MSKRWKALRAAIVAWSFVPTVIILAAVAVLTYVSYMRVTNQNVVDREREVAYLSSARLRDELTKFTDVLASLARTEEISSGLQDRQQTGLVKTRLRLSVFDGGVVLLDNFGKVVATEPVRAVIHGQDWSDRVYFGQLLANRGPVFSNTLADGPEASKVVVLAVPITGPNGEFVGALAGMFKLGTPTVSPFYASIVRLRIGQSRSSYLVDGKGRVIYHNDNSQIGANLENLEVVQAVTGGHSGALRLRDEDGDDIVTAYASVPGTPWGLVTEEEWGALTADTRRYGQILLVLLGLGMVLPALGVLLMVRERNRDAIVRERMEQELHVARIIQKTLLPKELPHHPGWEIAVLWQPARAVSGDFYDFIQFPENRLAFVIADVTDKGIPAGLVMASARTIIRGVSERLRSPAEILGRTNSLLTHDIPHNMFVTALYAELDLETGKLWYANAGQNLPYRKCNGQVNQLEATGLPLGLLPNIAYDEFETVIQPGEVLLLFSDGLVEAHNSRQEMYGNQRLVNLMREQAHDNMSVNELIDEVVASLQAFTSADWEQEDDVTLVAVRRLPPAGVETTDGERQ